MQEKDNKFTENANIKKLLSISRDISDLNAVLELLGWDQETYMPSLAFAARQKQAGLLAALAHEKSIYPEHKKLLEVLKREIEFDSEKFSLYDRSLVREFENDFNKKTQLPKNFVRELAEQSSISTNSWKHARKEENFSIFEKDLEKLVELKIKETKFRGYKESPYDALLDLYEPGMTEKKLESIFEPLKNFTSNFLQKIQKSKIEINDSILNRKYDIQKQWDIGIEILNAIGFDFERGRQDKSIHPFTSEMGTSTDVRITTRFFENDIRSALMSTIHECGHALYEQGVDTTLDRTTLGTGVSLGIHESQSRMWENFIGRSPEFWDFWFQRLNAYFPDIIHSSEKNEFIKSINKVIPSFIRVEADEITYNLHIILRFEIERGLIKGEILVKDLPKVWNMKMEQYLGITPQNDSQGVLQDIHWSSGAFGYFPTYTLGNIYAAQFWKTLNNENLNIKTHISQGNYSDILDWLRKNIHKHGRIYSAEELCKNITGEELNSEYLIDYLTTKYSKLYEL